MKFAHLADCHIGGWREPRLRELGIESFRKAVDVCIKEYVGFVLISGDLFDSSLPSIDLLKDVASALSKLKDYDIPVYVIPGSHDFSPSGKTMLDVLEKAGLIENVMKFDEQFDSDKIDRLLFTEDRTGTKITGLLGRKGGLEREDYKRLDKTHLEKEKGFKIFMFHTALDEFKPEELEKVEGMSFSRLPKNFDYYAGGHVHYIYNVFKEGHGMIVFPGPLFPNNFLEIEKAKHGGFYIVDVKAEAEADKKKRINLRYVPLNLKSVASFAFDANDKDPDEVEKEILKSVKDVRDKIVTLRIAGILKSGKPSDINYKRIFSKINNAHLILKNTAKLRAKEFKEFDISESVGDVEENVIREHLKENIFGEEITLKLIESLNKEKNEGEKSVDFENRILRDVVKVLKLEL